jgi:hypothetical protein
VIRVLLAVSSVVYFASALDPCGLDLPGTDAGDDSGESDAAAGPSTIGAACTQIVTEFCQQAVNRCNLTGFSVSDCVSADMSYCCSSGDTCDQKSTASSSDISTCKSDTDQEDCNFVVNSTLPPSCDSLLHP